MFSKKLYFFTAIVFISISSLVIAMQPDVIFQELVTVQDNINPSTDETLGMAFQRTNSFIRNRNQVAQAIFNQAQTTGLVAQYKSLLLSPSNNNELNTFIDLLLSSEGLQITAYYQNKFGNGQPFSYNGQGGDDVALGTYINPTGQKIIITRYGFMKGLLDALMELSKNPQSSSNTYFANLYKTINKNLTQALDNAKKQTIISRFSLLTERAKTIILTGNQNAINAISSFVMEPLEKIVNQYR